MTFSSSNTYTGITSINGGTLQLNNINAVQNSTVAVNVPNGLAFGTSIGSFNLGGLSGSGSFALSDTGSNAIALQFGGNNASTTFSAPSPAASAASRKSERERQS